MVELKRKKTRRKIWQKNKALLKRNPPPFRIPIELVARKVSSLSEKASPIAQRTQKIKKE